jgi:hypothetical protein
LPWPTDVGAALVNYLRRTRPACLSITHKMRSPPSLPMRQIGESYESFVVSC